jgi:heat-inducible transcriptional repressor
MLEVREALILKSIIREHVLTGEPIGSAAVLRGTRLALSGASIRHIMATLEERGLLSQPHTSAGRVPTSRAYRLYVDHMIPRPRMALAQAQEIDRALWRSSREIDELLAEASRQLSRGSHQLGIVMAPDLRRLLVERIEFVLVGAQRVVAILVGRGGVVHNRILDLPQPLDQGDLDRIGRHLTHEFAGRTLPEIRNLLWHRMSQERADYDRLVATSLELGQRAVAAEGLEAGVFLDGASNLVSSPEFNDPEKLKNLLKALEEKRALVDLLSRVLEGNGVQVLIGDENPSADLAQCSLVASAYSSGDRVMGTVGIVGPTRMEYARAMALVDYLARSLSRFFSSPGN